MAIKREKIETLKRINATRVAEYQEQALNSAATKIQSIWRGYKVRSTGRVSLPDTKDLESITTDKEKIEPPDKDVEERVVRIVERIKEKSTYYNNLNYSRSQLQQKCKDLNELMEKKSKRDSSRIVNPLLLQNLDQRTSYWLEACERLDLSLSYSRSDQDPVVDDKTRSAHISAIKKANQGWWKEKLNNDIKWNEQDLEFDAWIAEIGSIPVTGGERYF